MSDYIYEEVRTADGNAKLLTQEAATEVTAAQDLLDVGASQAACAGNNNKQPPQDGEGKYIRPPYAPLKKLVAALTLCPHVKGNSIMALPGLRWQKNNTYAGTNENEDAVLGTHIKDPATKATNAGTNK